MATRVSQEVVEALATGGPAVRVSQEVVEALATGTPGVRVSQQVIEALAAHGSHARVSQLVVEVLIPNVDIPSPPLYPHLAGVQYKVNWTPSFYNMPTVTMPAGADIDLGLFNGGLHQFNLSYNFLRSTPVRERYWKNEFGKMFGFYNQLKGSNGRFLFHNPDDEYVVGQVVGTTDGLASVFGPIPRTYGGGGFHGTEPVGWVNRNKIYNVYLDGELQSQNRYTILHTNLCNQRVKFYDTPAAGREIKIDMFYFYYCKFHENSNTFEKFLERVWNINDIQIMSCREGV